MPIHPSEKECCLLQKDSRLIGLYDSFSWTCSVWCTYWLLFFVFPRWNGTQYMQPPCSRQHSVQTLVGHNQIMLSLFFNARVWSFPRWHVLWRLPVLITSNSGRETLYVKAVGASQQHSQAGNLESWNQLEMCYISLVSMAICSLLQSLWLSPFHSPFFFPCCLVILCCPSHFQLWDDMYIFLFLSWLPISSVLDCSAQPFPGLYHFRCSLQVSDLPSCSF